MADSIRVAAVQAAPVYLDREATIDRVVTLVEEAGANGAQLIVFGEAFVPGYPDWTWRTNPWHDAPWFDRLQDQAVVVGSEATDRLGDAARAAGAVVVVGIDERDLHGSTLYNSMLDPTGHYARPDVFQLTVNTRPKRAVTYVDDERLST